MIGMCLLKLFERRRHLQNFTFFQTSTNLFPIKFEYDHSICCLQSHKLGS